MFYVCSKLRVVNDLLEGIHFVASIEAMYLGVRAGIHPSIIYDIISNAAGSSRLWEFLYSFVFSKQIMPNILFSKILLH
jgi:3-hydroxyisobutyrate dehydrogenase-like beta-hydroxyacid dehydrogenase